jgi:hypothetical protein
MLRLYLPGRILGALESLQLHNSFHSSQISLRNGSSEFGGFKRFQQEPCHYRFSRARVVSEQKKRIRGSLRK